VSKVSTELAAKRVDDHLKWVLSNQFVAAFEVFDRKNDVSGVHFEGQAALCTLGMTGCEKSAAQIEAWLSASPGDKKNM
jgi:hypothetical protein